MCFVDVMTIPPKLKNLNYSMPPSGKHHFAGSLGLEGNPFGIGMKWGKPNWRDINIIVIQET